MIAFLKVVSASLGSVFLIAAGAVASGVNLDLEDIIKGLTLGFLGGILWFGPLKSFLTTNRQPPSPNESKPS